MKINIETSHDELAAIGWDETDVIFTTAHFFNVPTINVIINGNARLVAALKYALARLENDTDPMTIPLIQQALRDAGEEI